MRNPHRILIDHSVLLGGPRAQPVDIGRIAVGQRIRRHCVREGAEQWGFDFLQDDDGKWTISQMNAIDADSFARLERPGTVGCLVRFANRPVQFGAGSLLGRFAPT